MDAFWAWPCFCCVGWASLWADWFLAGNFSPRLGCMASPNSLTPASCWRPALTPTQLHHPLPITHTCFLCGPVRCLASWPEWAEVAAPLSLKDLYSLTSMPFKLLLSQHILASTAVAETVLSPKTSLSPSVGSRQEKVLPFLEI